MGFYFTEEHFEKAFHEMTKKLFEEMGGKTLNEWKTIETLVIAFYVPAFNGEEGVAFEKSPSPLLDKVVKNDGSTDRVLTFLVESGYLVHFEDKKYDYYRMMDEFKDFFNVHFAKECMKWEPDPIWEELDW